MTINMEKPARPGPRPGWDIESTWPKDKRDRAMAVLYAPEGADVTPAENYALAPSQRLWFAERVSDKFDKSAPAPQDRPGLVRIIHIGFVGIVGGVVVSGRDQMDVLTQAALLTYFPRGRGNTHGLINGPRENRRADPGFGWCDITIVDRSGRHLTITKGRVAGLVAQAGGAERVKSFRNGLLTLANEGLMADPDPRAASQIGSGEARDGAAAADLAACLMHPDGPPMTKTALRRKLNLDGYCRPDGRRNWGARDFPQMPGEK